jgi:hypothetical protein
MFEETTMDFPKTYLFPLLGALLLPGILLSQKIPSEPHTEMQAGQGGLDLVTGMTENWRGDLAAAGLSLRGENGGSDIFFLLTDRQLNKKIERYIGRDGDDGAYCVTTAHDGRWLVAGYSSMPSAKSPARAHYRGGKDGWLLLLAEDGHTEQEFILGTSFDDEFTDAFPLTDGGFLVCGTSGQSAWAMRLDAEGKPIWDKKIQHQGQPTAARSAAFSEGEKLWLTGFTQEKKGNRLWAACLEPQNGRVIFEKSFPKEQGIEGMDIALLDSQSVGITGLVKSKKGREEGFLLRISLSSEVKSWHSFGGRENDQLRQMLRLHDGRLCFAGRGKSFQRGSRRDRAWVVLADSKGNALQEGFFGSKTNDEANCLIQTGDGSLLVAGFSSQNLLKAEQAYLLKLTQEARTYPPTEPLSVELGTVFYPNGQHIEPGKRTFLPVFLKNPSKDGLTGLRLKVETAGNFASPLPIQEAVLPVLPAGHKQVIGLPLFVGDNERPGTHVFKLQIFHGKRAVSDEATFSLQVGSEAAPELALTAEAFPIGQGQTSTLLVKVENQGAGAAQGVSLFLGAPESIQAPDELYLGEIPPGATRTKEVLVKRLLPGDATVKVRVADAGFQHERVVEVLLPDDPGETFTSHETIKPGQEQLAVVWLSPNPDQFEKPEIVWHENEISISVKVVSSKPVEKQHFCIEINGQPCTEGIKMDEVQLRGTKYSRTFQQKIPLREGKNMLQAIVENAAGKRQTEPMFIVYSPRKPNLHLVTIGVPTADLKYTVNDAAEFARSLAGRQREGRVFQSVFTDTLLSEGETTKTGILKSLRRLQYRHADRQIRSNDLLVVFISSHGLNSQTGGFRIAASDYDNPFLEETSLDFESDIANYLRPIDCHKLFIVDACKSGSAPRTLGSSVVEWAQLQRDLNLLVSCRANEYSYEDDQWRNGAFTESLLQAFDLFDSDRSAEVDADGNGLLDTEELYRFVEKQVPQLVSAKRPKASTSQRPFMVRAGSGGKAVLLGR